MLHRLVVVALLARGCDSAPAPQPTPLPAKIVAAKVEREHLLDPTTYYLVAADKTVCYVPMPAYALAKVGDTVECDWSTRFY
jgi:hypothetical protein